MYLVVCDVVLVIIIIIVIRSPKRSSPATKTNHHLVKYDVANPLHLIPSPYTIVCGICGCLYFDRQLSLLKLNLFVENWFVYGLRLFPSSKCLNLFIIINRSYYPIAHPSKNPLSFIPLLHLEVCRYYIN